MASLLRSGSFLRLFSGFKHSLSSSYSRYEVTRIQKLQASHINLSIIRSFAAQKPLENVASPQIPAPSLDKILYRIDGEIRRTGRISKKDIEDVFGELKFLKYASSTQSLLLIRCCGSLVPEEMPEVRNKLVQEIWDTLIKFNIPLDISHYNALLKVYLENEHKFSPSEFLATLEKGGIEPNRVTYQRLISRYCYDGDIDGASKILEYMKEKGAPVNENVFNALVMGHARANDMESAHAVLGVMQGAGLDPSSETYMMLMVGYAEHGDIEGLNKVLSESEAAEIGLHNREYMEVVFALAKNGHTQHISQFIEKLEKVYGYQQDAMNLIYRLLNIGCDEVAYQLFETMSVPQNADGETTPVGIFFIKQLIKSGMYPVSTTIQYCQRMKREGLNMYSLEKALQFALTFEKPELAMAISRVMLEDGAPVRSHYFWPIIVQYANQGQMEMLCKTIKDMISMEVPLSLETCRDYLIPSLAGKGKDEEPTIAALKDCGMPLSSIINGYVAYYLDRSDVTSAAKLLSRYRFKLPKVLRRDLAEAYIKSKDATAAASVLGQMINDNQKKDDGDAEEASSIDEDQEKESSPDRFTQDVGGIFVMDVLMMGRLQNAAMLLEPLLEAMQSRGINISSNSAASVKSRLGEHMTEKIFALLDILSSGDLSLQPLSRESRPFNLLSVEELEHRLTELEIKNLPRTAVLSQLLTFYARKKDVEKAETAKSKLEAFEYPLTAGQYALLIDMYAIEGMREKALNLYKDFKTREPDSKLHATKILRLASVMILEGQFEEGVKLLEENAPEASEAVEDPNISFACSRFLNSVSEKCDIAAIQQLIDVLIQHNYAKKSISIVCGPLIRAHLSNDNLDGAMEAFEKVCKEYQVTPLKHELTLACIKLEDTVKLQKIMDLSIEIHGEMNSLYDLVFAFIECGKIRQAKKILDTPGLRARHQRLESRCKRLLEDKRFTELEHLVTITKDVFDIDRHVMFMYLLEACKKQNDCDKALGIWTTMQEENIEPSDSFLWELGQLLKKHNQEVPFAMPQPPSNTVPPVVPKPAIPAAEANVQSSPKSVFNKALREKNLIGALDAKKEYEKSGGQLSVTDESKLIEALVQDSKLQEATKLARELVVAKQYPLPRIFNFLLNRLAQAGEVESIAFFDEHLDENLKRTLSYNNRLCNAYMEAGRTEELLDNLLSLAESSDIDAASIRAKIPTGGLMGILERQETALPKVKELAEKFAKHGITAPANCIWIHLFAEGLQAEANEIYNKYLADSKNERLLFGPICQKARKTGNSKLLPPLLEILNSREDTRLGAKGVAYSCWIDVLCASKQYDEALSVLEGSLKHVELENYNTTALQQLKEGLSQSNKVFPYTIPKKVKREQPASSDSD